MIIEGNLNATNKKFAIISSRFNEFIVDKLASGAKNCIIRHGGQISDIDEILVPGAYELPLAVKNLAMTKKYDGLIALGCVIKGATAHFDFVAGESSSGLLSQSLEHNIPIGFGVLTTDTIEQAIERAGTKAGNKGFEVALAVIEMCDLLEKIK